jgi:hypothetical protein
VIKFLESRKEKSKEIEETAGRRRKEEIAQS